MTAKKFERLGLAWSIVMIVLIIVEWTGDNNLTNIVLINTAIIGSTVCFVAANLIDKIEKQTDEVEKIVVNWMIAMRARWEQNQ